MPTPICNCPADIGWLPQSSWPYGTDPGQPIYCVNGDPVVPPRPSFIAIGDARVDLPVGVFPLIAGGTIAVPTVVAPPTYPAAVVAPLTITNNSDYPMKFMYHSNVSITLNMASTSVLGIGQRVNFSGGIVDTVVGAGSLYGQDANTTPGVPFGVYREFNFTWPVPGLLAPGVATTITPEVVYYYSAGGPSLTDYIISVSSAVRVWGGNP